MIITLVDQSFRCSNYIIWAKFSAKWDIFSSIKFSHNRRRRVTKCWKGDVRVPLYAQLCLWNLWLQLNRWIFSLYCLIHRSIIFFLLEGSYRRSLVFGNSSLYPIVCSSEENTHESEIFFWKMQVSHILWIIFWQKKRCNVHISSIYVIQTCCTK